MGGRGRRQQAFRRGANRSSAPAEPRELDLDGLLSTLVGGEPLPTQRDFVFSPERYKFYRGLAGCAKTSSLCASGLIPALLYPGSKWLVTRAEQWTLEETTYTRFKEMVGRLGEGAIVDEVTSPLLKVWLAPARPDARGNLEPSEFTFHAIDEVGKVGSTEYDGVLVDEAAEMDSTIIGALKARLRHRRPDGGQGPYFLNMVSNPTSRAHWLYRELSGLDPEHPTPWAKEFVPKPRENEENLPPNYYEEASRGMSAEMKLRLIEGEWGPDPRGEAVFPDFRHQLHVAELKLMHGQPMVRGWDFGRRRPAVVWGQVTPEGWVNRLRAELGKDVGLKAWAQHVLRVSQTLFSGASGWTDFCDPHGQAKRDNSEESSFDILRSLGLNPQGRDVGIQNGLDRMTAGLCTLVKGRPRSQYDREGCRLLIEGYGGGYIWPNSRPGHQVKDKPWADGYYEHLMDADRYLEVGLSFGPAVPAGQHARTLRKVRGG